MNYSQLTSEKQILAWLQTQPNINQPDSHNLYFSDWIIYGYRGKLNIKKEIFEQIVSQINTDELPDNPLESLMIFSLVNPFDSEGTQELLIDKISNAKHKFFKQTPTQTINSTTNSIIKHRTGRPFNTKELDLLFYFTSPSIERPLTCATISSHPLDYLLRSFLNTRNNNYLFYATHLINRKSVYYQEQTNNEYTLLDPLQKAISFSDKETVQLINEIIVCLSRNKLSSLFINKEKAIAEPKKKI